MIAPSTWIAAAAIAGALVLAGVQTVRLADEKADHAATVATHASAVAKAAQAHATAATEQRDIFEKRIGEKDAIIVAAQNVQAETRIALARSERAAGGLRDDLAAFIARSSQAGGNPGDGAGGEASGAPVRMLGGLFEEADRFAGIVAGALASSRAAGISCEASYQSLGAP